MSTGTISWKGGRLGQGQQQHPTGDAARQGRDPEHLEALALADELGAIAERGADRAGRQAHGVADVRDHRRVADRKQHGEGDQRPRPDDRVDGPGGHPGEQHQDRLGPAHRAGLYVTDRDPFRVTLCRQVDQGGGAVPIKAEAWHADVARVRRRPRGAALAIIAGLLLTAAPAQVGAHAAEATRHESAAAARAAAQQAADQVHALKPRVERALRAYELAVAAISGSVSRSVVADQQADATAARALAKRREVDNQVRALYMSGGSVALMASVLTAPNATDALRRVAYVQRLVETTSALAADSTATADGDAARAVALEAAADHEVVTAADVTRRYDQLTDALAEAGASLSKLSAHARTLAAAERAAAQLLAYSASPMRRPMPASPPPAPRRSRRTSGGCTSVRRKTCQGLSWTVLAAIGQVESGHGRNPSTSYAGAQGPMQFLPSTFAAYAVDGDGDGDMDIMDPADSIFTAGHYLCANGAGHGADGLHNAIWHYNHAEWYVALVLKLAGQIADQASGTTHGG